MECKKCNKKATINLGYLEPLCNNCFCEIIEKRIRRYTRINEVFKKNDNILIINELCLFIVKNIIEGLPVNIHFKIDDVLNSNVEFENYVSEDINKVVIPWTLDDEVCSFLYGVFNNNLSITLNNAQKSVVKLLLNITNKEAQLYAGIKNLEFMPNNLFPDIQNFLDSLEKYYPDTKFGLMKSKEFIEKLQ